MSAQERETERGKFERLHKAMLNRIFFHISKIFDTCNNLVKELISGTDYFGTEFRPAIVGGFAYMKHVETFSDITPLFSDDIDIKITVVKTKDQVNDESNKKLLYTLKFFRLLLIAHIYNFVNTFMDKLKDEKDSKITIQYKISFAGAFGNSILSLIKKLPDEFPKNILQLAAYTITYKGRYDDYKMGLVDTAFFMRDDDTCDPTKLIIRQFCSYKQLLSIVNDNDSIGFKTYLFAQEKLKSHIKSILRDAKNSKIRLKPYEKFFELLKGLDTLLKTLQSLDKTVGMNETQQTSLQNMITKLETVLKVIRTENSSSNSDKLTKFHGKLHELHQEILAYKSIGIQYYVTKNHFEIIGTMNDVDIGNVDPSEKESFKYLANKDYLILDTVRMLLQINAFNQKNVTLPAVWRDVYKFHKYAVKFLHVVYTYYHAEAAKESFKTNIDMFKKLVFKTYNDIVAKGKKDDVNTNYMFWTNVAKALLFIQDGVQEFMDISKIVLPYTTGYDVFYGGSIYNALKETKAYTASKSDNVSKGDKFNNALTKLNTFRESIPNTKKNTSLTSSKSANSGIPTIHPTGNSTNVVMENAMNTYATYIPEEDTDKFIPKITDDIEDIYAQYQDLYIPGRYDADEKYLEVQQKGKAKTMNGVIPMSTSSGGSSPKKKKTTRSKRKILTSY